MLRRTLWSAMLGATCVAAAAQEPSRPESFFVPPPIELAQRAERQQESLPPPPTDDGPGTTLDELELLAQMHHPALREASARVSVAQGEAVQAGLCPNPTIYASSPQLAGSISQYNAFVGQDFITAGKLRLDRAALEREVLQRQLQFTRTRFDVLTNVREQFYAAAAAQRRVEVLEQLVGVTEQSAGIGRKLLDAGEINRADSLLLEIEYDRATLQSRNAAALLNASRRELAAAVGVPDMPIGRLSFDFGVPLPEYEAEALRLGVVNQNALAAVAAVEIQRTQVRLRRAVVEPVPNFNVQAGFQYSLEGPLHDQGYGQLAFNVPLWNRNQGAIRAARADTARAVAGLQRTEAELSQETAQALGEFSAATARAAIYEQEILPKAGDVFTVNRNLFEQGQTDFLRLLQAQRTLIEADLGNVDAQEARWTAASRLAGLLQLEQFP